MQEHQDLLICNFYVNIIAMIWKIEYFEEDNGRFKMNQPMPKSPQEAWLEVQEKGMITFPKRWWDELGMQNGMFVKAKKEGQRVIIETQAVEEKLTLPIKQLKAEDQQIEELYQL